MLLPTGILCVSLALLLCFAKYFGYFNNDKNMLFLLYLVYVVKVLKTVFFADYFAIITFLNRTHVCAWYCLPSAPGFILFWPYFLLVETF